MSDCAITPEAVLSTGCWDLSQTRNLLFSTRKHIVNEPLEEGEIINDLSEYSTWEAFLESGKMLMLRVTVGEDTSTGEVTGEIGGRLRKLSDGEARYSFNVDTGCPYIQQLETFKGFKGGYLYYMNEGKSVGGILSTTSGEVEPIQLNEVYATAPRGINNGADINSIMVNVCFDAVQMFDMCIYGTKFRYKVLDQLYILDSLKVVQTVGAGINFEGMQFTEDYEGETNDGDVTYTVNGTPVDATYSCNSTLQKLFVNDTALVTGDVVRVEVSGSASFWNEDYYNPEITHTVTA